MQLPSHPAAAAPMPSAKENANAIDSVSETEVDAITILAGKLFDSQAATLRHNVLLTVSPRSGLIVAVDTFEDDPAWLAKRGVDLADEAATIDLRGLTVLPGFVDAHVHLFLHPYSETSWEDQVTRESLAERTIRATRHARDTLMAGYTAVRDLGTEGAQDADIALRKCLSGPNPVVPGPRYFVANRAIVATGSYGPKNRLYPNREGVENVFGAEVADGELGCKQAVRRQIGAGADWIKFYSDYRIRACMADVAPFTASGSTATFDVSERRAMIQEAHRLGVKVCTHATEGPTLQSVIEDSSNNVDSIEHGYRMSHVLNHSLELLDDRKAAPIFWVPTLATYWTLGKGQQLWAHAAASFQAFLQARPARLRIACGGDTSVFAHGDNALEMKLMHELGADWREVLQWCTLGGWECVRSMRWEGAEGDSRMRRIEECREDARVVGDNEVPFGVLKKGFAADIVATSGDLEKDFAAAVNKTSILFVMKGGKVYKRGGKAQI